VKRKRRRVNLEKRELAEKLKPGEVEAWIEKKNPGEEETLRKRNSQRR